MPNRLLPSLVLIAVCAKALPVPVTITKGPIDPKTGKPSSIIIESQGTDIVVGNKTDDPGKTIFVPGGNGGNGITVIPTTKDPIVLTPGGVPITISGGSDGVVILPGKPSVNGTGGGGGLVIS